VLLSYVCGRAFYLVKWLSQSWTFFTLYSIALKSLAELAKFMLPCIVYIHTQVIRLARKCNPLNNLNKMKTPTTHLEVALTAVFAQKVHLMYLWVLSRSRWDECVRRAPWIKLFTLQKTNITNIKSRHDVNVVNVHLYTSMGKLTIWAFCN